MVIYLITNSVNGKQYVGQTVQALHSRFAFHTSRASRCLALKSAIAKYGKENFTIKEFAKCQHVEELNKIEQEKIKEFNTLAPNGYNLTTGGKGHTYSAESRKKMSESGKKRKPISPETSKKLSERMVGAKNWHFGKKFSKEHREKLSVSHMGNISRKGQPIRCNESGKIYDSMSQAAKE